MKKTTRPRDTRQHATGPEALRIQRDYALAFSQRRAEDYLKRLPAFERESSEPGFDTAVKRYTTAFWAWVMEATSDILLDRINCLGPADFGEPDCLEVWQRITIAKLEYLFQRAVFLAGLKYEKAHDAEWYAGFAKYVWISSILDDKAFFKQLAAPKQKRRMVKVRQGWGHTRYWLLALWLAGGLWRLPNDGERADCLNKFLRLGRSENRINDKGFKTARERLNLASG